jgi:hypothetical protein
MASIPQIRNRLLEGFSEKQADLLAHVVIEAHDDLVNQADFHALTGVVRELADSQKELAEAQKDLAGAQRDLAGAQKDLAGAQKDLAEAQKDLTDAQKRTEGTLNDVVKTQQKMLIRLDRLDGHMLEDKVAKNLPAFLGREFRRCRVLDRCEFVETLEGRLPEAELADLMRADVIAVAKRADQVVHIVVEVSCTADADDLARAVRRAAALTMAGYSAIGIVACESISPQTLDAARTHGLRVLTGGWLLPEAA